jgi:hypothetical protein
LNVFINVKAVENKNINSQKTKKGVYFLSKINKNNENKTINY